MIRARGCCLPPRHDTCLRRHVGVNAPFKVKMNANTEPSSDLSTLEPVFKSLRLGAPLSPGPFLQRAIQWRKVYGYMRIRMRGDIALVKRK